MASGTGALKGRWSSWDQVKRHCSAFLCPQTVSVAISSGPTDPKGSQEKNKTCAKLF